MEALTQHSHPITQLLNLLVKSYLVFHFGGHSRLLKKQDHSSQNCYLSLHYLYYLPSLLGWFSSSAHF
jgi:hypothetical protein